MTQTSHYRSLAATILLRTLATLCVGMVPASAMGQATTAPVESAAPVYEPPRERDADGRVLGTGRVGWWNDSVFYQVFVRSFQDSTTGPLANDGIGDFRGLIERLDYLNDGDPATTTDLGVTGLWLMPIHPSPSYHGYDITDYTGVNPQYGTMDDFRELMQACHARGIRVVLDLVINHTSDQHPWFREAAAPDSPKRDWFIWRDADPGYKGPWNQNVWHTLRGQRGGPVYYGLFSNRMPDLNFRNEAVSQEIFDVIRFWIDRENNGPGVDGFRLDAIRHLIEDGRQQDNTVATHEWLQRFYAEYKKVNPDAVAVGEVWASTAIASSYVGNQMDLAFEFDMAGAMVQSVRSGDAAAVLKAQETTNRHFPPNQYGRFLTNHDQVRTATELKNDPAMLRLAASVLLLGPGVPFIYYAEELGMPGNKPDPQLRTPMPWDVDAKGFSAAKPWMAPLATPPTINVAAQISDEDSLLSHYRELIALRTSQAALLHGGYLAAQCDHKAVYAFLRTPETENARPVLVVINLGNENIASADLSFETAASVRVGMRGTSILSPELPPIALIAAPEAASGVRATVTDLAPRSTRVYELK